LSVFQPWFVFVMVTEIIEMPNRGQALVVDSGWREVADTALALIKRFI
jgi:non-heme chloroperoxidase